jgi:hypothetical protein
VEFPRPDCPSCARPLVFWSGYRRHVRAAGRCRKIFVPRLRCGPCRVSHALLPATDAAVISVLISLTTSAITAAALARQECTKPAETRAGHVRDQLRGPLDGHVLEHHQVNGQGTQVRADAHR